MKVGLSLKYQLQEESKEAEKQCNLWEWFLMQWGVKIYLGHEQREGWNGNLPFYLFWCKECGEHSKDYPHSWPEQQYLICVHCDARHSFVPWWVPFKMIWGLIWFAFQLRFRSK
ncbi:MAG: hypothetical protein A3D92_24765 [Bacteroidetes bacterium RIFCSPHIGHO2_02_FULL_44_7]|nr:MAG: hypothetical protein A3D92_24765 [Bacteroidetes bacterium RIFCSPHIGHO2_02_FULL_44_7]